MYVVTREMSYCLLSDVQPSSRDFGHDGVLCTFRNIPAAAAAAAGTCQKLAAL